MAAKKKAASKTAKKSAPKASNSPTTKSTAMSYIADAEPRPSRSARR